MLRESLQFSLDSSHLVISFPQFLLRQQNSEETYTCRLYFSTFVYNNKNWKKMSFYSLTEDENSWERTSEKNQRRTHMEAQFLTSGGIIPPSEVPDIFSSYNILDLPENVKKVFYSFDCDMLPFFENQLGVVEACDNSADLWGRARSPESPFQPTPGSTRVRDPSPACSSSQSTFLKLVGQKMENFSGTRFETP